MGQCMECGARNSEHSSFCVRCGAALVNESAPTGDAPGSDTDRLDPVAESPAVEVEEAPSPPPVALEDAAAEEPADASPESLLAEAADLMGEGRADEAAARCREAIQLAPDMVAAYSMLGMAEEQRGNPIAAAGAYRRVLQLDPGRTVEREKLELLYDAGVARQHEPGPERGGDAETSSPLARWAPAIVGLAAAFLVMMILAGILLRVHGARVAERTYDENMAAARADLDKGDYQAAIRSFKAALAVRPDDNEARTGLEYAQRKLRAARSGGTGRAQASVPLAPIVPSGGPNPFQPVPIGPTGVTDMPDQPRQVERPQPRTHRTHRPPVVDTTTPVVDTADTSSTTSGDSIPFSPLEDEPAAGSGQPADAGGGQPADTEPKHGEITIWTSEPPLSSSSSSPSSSTQSSSSSSAPEQSHRADQLREQGDHLRASGQYEQAISAYNSAIEAYKEQSQADPATRDANQAAIRACEAAREMCQSSQGQ
ncbi:MAG: tetratricopeptide repeat protein [Armatimonadetes bacterium]|nr:tetratricopeptide repeat protein [Armatimonadota bacterium]